VDADAAAAAGANCFELFRIVSNRFEFHLSRRSSRRCSCRVRRPLCWRRWRATPWRRRSGTCAGASLRCECGMCKATRQHSAGLLGGFLWCRPGPASAGFGQGMCHVGLNRQLFSGTLEIDAGLVHREIKAVGFWGPRTCVPAYDMCFVFVRQAAQGHGERGERHHHDTCAPVAAAARPAATGRCVDQHHRATHPQASGFLHLLTRSDRPLRGSTPPRNAPTGKWLPSPFDPQRQAAAWINTTAQRTHRQVASFTF
jgi:hypothetical protein